MGNSSLDGNVESLDQIVEIRLFSLFGAPPQTIADNRLDGNVEPVRISGLAFLNGISP
jgi:hypothetical protein